MSESGSGVVTTDSPAVTEQFGAWLGEFLVAGMVVDLRGELGAGKTHLVRGMARALAVSGPVHSPTYTICHVHEGPVPLYHLDAYRVEDPAELLLQGWDDLLNSGVVVVEWGERVAELLATSNLAVTLEHLSATRRRLRLVVPDLDLWQRMTRDRASRSDSHHATWESWDSPGP